MIIGVSFPHDHTRTTPSFMLAVRIRSPELEYIISVIALVWPEKLARSLSVDGAVNRIVNSGSHHKAMAKQYDTKLTR